MMIEKSVQRCKAGAFGDALLVCVVLGLSACGGGGSGGNAGAPTVPGGGGGGSTPNNPINPDDITWRRTYNNDLDFTILYPSNWQVLNGSGANDESVVHFESVSRILYIEVIAAPMGMRERDASYTNVQELERNNIQLRDLTAEQILMDAELLEPVGILETNFDVNGISFSITFVAEKKGDLFDQYLMLAKQAVDSFVIGNRVFEIERLYDPGKPAVSSDGQEFVAIACRDTERSRFFGGAIVGIKFRPGHDRLGQEFLIDDEKIPCSELSPSISWNGTNYLVTYIRQLQIPIVWNGQTVLTDQLAVVGKRIAPDGTVLDNDPILISTEGTRQDSNLFKAKPAYDASNTFDGSRHLVVWEQAMDIDTYGLDGFRQIHGAFVEPSGAVSPNFPIFEGMNGLYGTQNYAYWHPDMAIGSDRIMVVVGPRAEPSTKGDPSPIYAQFIDFSGIKLFQAPILVQSDLADKRPRYPNVAFDGSNFIVAWIQGVPHESSINDGFYGVFAKAVAPDGQILNGDADSEGFEVIPEKDRDREYLALQADGTQMVAFYGEIGGSLEPGVWGVTFESNLLSRGTPQPVWGDRTDHLPNNGPAPHSLAIVVGESYGAAVWPSHHIVRSWFFERGLENP